MTELRIKRLNQLITIAEEKEKEAIRNREMGKAGYYFSKASTYARELRGAK